MLVVIANNIPPAVRGRLKLWFGYVVAYTLSVDYRCTNLEKGPISESFAYYFYLLLFYKGFTDDCLQV